MGAIILVLFLIVCVLMTIVILLQSSKGGGLAGAFGGPGMGSVFGGRGAATFLSKTTTVLAMLFFLLSFVLSKMASNQSEDSGSIVAEELENVSNTPSAILPPVQESAPAVGNPAVEQDTSN